MNYIEPNVTIKDLRQRHRITTQDLAEMAGVPQRVPYLMEIGCPVGLDEATKVMQTLFALTNGHSLPNAFPGTSLKPF